MLFYILLFIGIAWLIYHAQREAAIRKRREYEEEKDETRQYTRRKWD